MTYTDPDYDTDDLDPEDDGPGLVGKLRRDLKAANKRSKALEEQVAQNSVAARRVAFLDAGIPDSPQLKFFREHYTGGLDPEAIKAAAISNGFLSQEDHSSEVDALDLQSQTQAGGAPPAAPGDMDQFEADIAEAVARAPRGDENKAINEVYLRHSRQV